MKSERSIRDALCIAAAGEDCKASGAGAGAEIGETTCEFVGHDAGEDHRIDARAMSFGSRLQQVKSAAMKCVDRMRSVVRSIAQSRSSCSIPASYEELPHFFFAARHRP